MSSKALNSRRESYSRDLDLALQRIVTKLAARPEVHKIILFGSFARGRKDLFTDLDLAIIMESESDFVTRTAELYRSLEAGVDLDILVYTPQEFTSLQAKNFGKNLLKNAQVLYERR